MIVDKPEKIIHILESKVVHLSDPDCVTTATKLVRQDGVSDYCVATTGRSSPSVKEIQRNQKFPIVRKRHFVNDHLDRNS